MIQGTNAIIHHSKCSCAGDGWQIFAWIRFRKDHPGRPSPGPLQKEEHQRCRVKTRCAFREPDKKSHKKTAPGRIIPGEKLIGDKEIMITVKKRDGRKEPFAVEKIVVSAIKSGAPLEVARTIAHGIEQSATDGISTREVKNRVLAMLKAKNPEWERNWMVFDTAVKKRSE